MPISEIIPRIVSFIRAWKSPAPQITPVEFVPDPFRKAGIYDRTCLDCHGKNGLGTEHGPPPNDLARLEKFDDAWYRNILAHGRPAKGMPTWQVLSANDKIFSSTFETSCIMIFFYRR